MFMQLIFLVALCGICLSDFTDIELPKMEFKPVRELPAGIPICSQNDLKINDCIKQAFQTIIPLIKNGAEELNIPPIDPFILEKSSFNYTQDMLQGRISLRNVKVYGLSETIVDRVDFKLEDDVVRLQIDLHVPHIVAEGDYKANIKLNDVQMTPKGYFNVSLTDVNIKARPTGELYEHEGHTYFRLTEFDNEPTIGDFQMYASGLMRNPALNELILDFINQYWREVYKTILPEAITTWRPLLMKLANEFFAALPFDLIFTKN